MRNLRSVEIASISGGLDSKDLGSAAGAWLGYHAGHDLWAFNVQGYNVGSVLAGVGVALVGSVAGRFVAAVSDKYLDPFVDSVVG